MKIFFDIDDTLFPSTAFSSLARRNALHAIMDMGVKQDYQKLESLLQQIIKKQGSNYQHHFDELCKKIKIKKPAKYIAAAIAAYHDTKTSIQPFPKVPITLLRLKEQGHQLFIATNGNSIKQWDKLIRLGISLYFDDVFVSEEIGREKDEKFFKEIIKTLNTKPEDCIMIGDREDADIKPAKKTGITTIRVLQGKHSNTPSKADYVIKNIDEILTIISSL